MIYLPAHNLPLAVREPGKEDWSNCLAAPADALKHYRLALEQGLPKARIFNKYGDDITDEMLSWEQAEAQR